MNRWILPGLMALLGLGLTGCGDEVPTAVGEDVFPVDPLTVEVDLPWAQFAESLQVIGGYGATHDLGIAEVAHAFQGALEARALVDLRRFPLNPSLPDSAGRTRTDTLPRYVGGRIIAVIDTVHSIFGGDRVRFNAFRVEQGFDPATASWTYAVDSAGARVAWDEPGAGPAMEIGTGLWTPGDTLVGDSVMIPIDSAAVAAWSDTAQAGVRTLRLEAETEGVRMVLTAVRLSLDARPTFNPDTTAEVGGSAKGMTFVYSPHPGSPDGLRVGGAPAWRSVIRMSVPKVLDGPPELCAIAGCPFTVDPERVNAALLVLESRRPPAGFQPVDTVFIDARAVLAPERLPRSPLGDPLITDVFGRPGRAILEDPFTSDPGTTISLDITPFVQDLVRDTTTAGEPAPDHLALLSAFEPLSVAFAAFAGPEDPGAPYLRILVTAADTVQIR